MILGMKRSTKGFYTVEAVIFLPLVILAILSLGYFIKVESIWENCIHGAVDESGRAAARAYGKPVSLIGPRIEERMISENPQLDQGKALYRGSGGTEGVARYRITGDVKMDLPLGFGREFAFETDIKYRGFIGRKDRASPAGAAELESYEAEDPVWIFPQSGRRYHSETCTYVKASVTMEILTSGLKRKYSSCGLCHSEEMPSGSVVYCFAGEDTAYHRGTCRSIDRRTAVTDRSEAVKKGYTPCAKCGGG